MSSQQVVDEPRRVEPPQRRSKSAAVALLLLAVLAGAVLLLLLRPDAPPPGPEGRQGVTGERTAAPREREAEPAPGQQAGAPLAVTATSALDGHPPEHTVDDDLATRWAPAGAEGALTIDVGHQVSIRGVEIAWYEGIGRQTRYEILGSTDGEGWSLLYSGTSSGSEARPESVELDVASVRLLRIAVRAQDDGVAGITHVRLDAEDALPPQLTRTTEQERAGEPTPDPAAQGGVVLVDADFEDMASGRMTVPMLRDAFESQGAVVPNASQDKLDAMTVEDNPTGTDQVLAITIPARKLSGMNLSVNLDEGPGFEEAYLSYRVQFADGFDFAPYGGKLPGLAGGPDGDHGHKRFPAGCQKVNGKNGFSARGMWVSWMPESNGQPMLDQYVYHKKQSSDCGDSYLYEGVNGLPVLEAGRWYHIQHRIKMNDPGRANGVVEAWLDGERVLSLSDMDFRNGRGWGVNVLYMATFFGGNNGNWKHDQDETVYLDDIVVHGIDPIAP